MTFSVQSVVGQFLGKTLELPEPGRPGPPDAR
jgi:hypothetical protein